MESMLQARARDIDDINGEKKTASSPTTTHHTPSRQSSASADVLLRSLELRESVEKELLHSVEKLVKLRHRGDAQQFRIHVARLKAQEQQIDDLQHRLDSKDEDVHLLRRQLSDLEQKCASQTVQLMTVKTELHSTNVEISTDRANKLKEKDEEIHALNEHLGELETMLHQANREKEVCQTELKSLSEKYLNMEIKLNQVTDSSNKKNEKLLNDIEHLKARINHADAYRTESNRQLSKSEDQAAVQAHNELKMKATIAKLELHVTEQKQKIKNLNDTITETNNKLKMAMERSLTFQKQKDDDRKEVETLREELIKLSEDSVDVSIHYYVLLKITTFPVSCLLLLLYIHIYYYYFTFMILLGIF